MFWKKFAEAAPEFAGTAQERFDRYGFVLLGTIRKDGTPRISPVEHVIAHGRLYLGMMWQSTKAKDLMRDPRCLVHNAVTNKDATDGEVKLRGRAIEITDLQERERYTQALYEKIQWRPEEPQFHLFTLDIENAAITEFVNGERKTRTWKAG